MSETAIGQTASGRAGREANRLFSERLESFLDQLYEGQAPNSGRFCPECYNPVPPRQAVCDHCQVDLQNRAVLTSLPPVVLEMYHRKQRRESLIVNSFAYFGLALGLALFLGLVAVNVLYLEKAFWFFLLATLVFLVGSRVLAGIIGGFLGDEIGYRYAQRKLHEEWTAHVAERQAAEKA